MCKVRRLSSAVGFSRTDQLISVAIFVRLFAASPSSDQCGHPEHQTERESHEQERVIFHFPARRRSRQSAIQTGAASISSSSMHAKIPM